MKEVKIALKSRRKPVQQRSKLTQDAILISFVRLLVEKGYKKLTMRDISMVAGVGLGTLYEHFPGKASIAAHCIYQRFRLVGEEMNDVLETYRLQPTMIIVNAVIDRILAGHTERPEEWSALIFLEREISSLSAYRGLYAHILHIWERILSAGTDANLFAGKSAQLIHAVVYGYVYQTLMLEPQKMNDPEFSVQLKTLILAYLQFPPA